MFVSQPINTLGCNLTSTKLQKCTEILLYNIKEVFVRVSMKIGLTFRESTTTVTNERTNQQTRPITLGLPPDGGNNRPRKGNLWQSYRFAHLLVPSCDKIG